MLDWKGGVVGQVLGRILHCTPQAFSVPWQRHYGSSVHVALECNDHVLQGREEMLITSLFSQKNE